MYLNNKNIVVLGANGRIGKSVCNLIIENNGKVIAVDHKKLRNMPFSNSFFFIKKKINSEVDVISLIKKIKSKSIHGLVNCIYPDYLTNTSFENVKKHQIEKSLNNHLVLTIIITKIFYNYFAKNNYGKIINVSSILGLKAPDFESYKFTNINAPIDYSLSKASIIFLTRYLAKYSNNKNININCVSPGGILGNQPEIFKKKYKNKCINKGLLNGEDVAGAIVFLLSDYAKYINGQNLIVDDGWSL